MAMSQIIQCPFFQRAFGWCVPIGALGGLVGLGGGEFRLPVLMYAVGFDAKSAVPLNLMVSLVTLALSAIVRSRALPETAILPFLPEVLGLAAGGIASAFYGARLVQRLTSKRLVQTIGVLLAALGVLMLAEVARPFGHAAMLPASPAVHVAAGFAIGTGIGLVSSILGVAGGELLIPTLMFIFGADIKAAGSASIVISLGVVLMGIWRYWRLGGFPHGRGVQRIASAMSAGSILGAVLGALAVAYAPMTFLKALLGCVLMAAAAKTIASHH
ncbi:MAG TPA: sulfite exporter TauE/SafE family protein [Stellaceae bacterium]|nr:sulfite exporter TauE/SafE family protein [Stellaceae bacterium]